MGEPRPVRERFWLFLGADAAPADVSALIREVHARGVADVVAAGAGRGAAVVSAVECDAVALIAPPADVSLRARPRLGLLRERGRPVLGRRHGRGARTWMATAPPAGRVARRWPAVSQ